MTRRKVSKRNLLSLIGKLSFTAKVISAGRLFLRRLIDLTTTVKPLHRRVTFHSQARADIQWWREFLPSWNGKAKFLKPHWTRAVDLDLFTNDSGQHWFGAYFAGDWFRGDWQPLQRLPCRPIQWQELFVIIAAATIWSSCFRGKRVRFNCDNEAVVMAWRCHSAKHPDLNKLLRQLFFIAAENNFTVALSHTPGRDNDIADALSRNQLTCFHRLTPQANRYPTTVPQELSEL